MNILIKYKKVLTILLIIIVLFLAIFLPIYFLVIKSSSSSSQLSQLCKDTIITFLDQPPHNKINNNMIQIEINANNLKSIKGINDMIDTINNTENIKPCYVSWFNTLNDINTPHNKQHNNKQHNIKSIIIQDNFIIITFEETTLNDINPFPLHIHTLLGCASVNGSRINSCDYRNEHYPKPTFPPMTTIPPTTT